MKRLRIALLIGLFLAPVLLHGHRHDALRSSSAPCAVCVAAHHSPAVVVAAIGTTASVLAVSAPPLPSLVVPTRPHRSPRAGRAPPSPAPASVV